MAFSVFNQAAFTDSCPNTKSKCYGSTVNEGNKQMTKGGGVPGSAAKAKI